MVAGTELKTYRYDSSRQGIDGQWRDAAAAVNYFSQIAGHDAWAMAAARLGNRANRAAFARDFWFNSDSSMQNVLKQPAALRPDWPSAVASSRRALSRVRTFLPHDPWFHTPSPGSRSHRRIARRRTLTSNPR